MGGIDSGPDPHATESMAVKKKGVVKRTFLIVKSFFFNYTQMNCVGKENKTEMRYLHTVEYKSSITGNINFFSIAVYMR